MPVNGCTIRRAGKRAGSVEHGDCLANSDAVDVTDPLDDITGAPATETVVPVRVQVKGHGRCVVVVTGHRTADHRVDPVQWDVETSAAGDLAQRVPGFDITEVDLRHQRSSSARVLVASRAKGMSSGG